MKSIVTRNANVMNGAPCFAGTRVAVRTLFEQLEADYSIDGFLDQFPTVQREQVLRVLGHSSEWVDSITAIKMGIADVDAGRVRPFAKVVDEIRRQHGWAD